MNYGIDKNRKTQDGNNLHHVRFNNSQSFHNKSGIKKLILVKPLGRTYIYMSNISFQHFLIEKY